VRLGQGASTPELLETPEGITMKRFSLALFLCSTLLTGSLHAGTEKTGFVHRTYHAKDGDAKYIVFVPHDYKATKEYPLILFLHGSGESGSDGEKQAAVGLGKAIRDRSEKFPFIVIFPQSHKRTWKADSDDARNALAILAEVQKHYKVDSKRIYLTGLSMGGSGTWSLAAAHPDRWAAIAPICGGANPETVDKIKNLPCWCFVGDKDNPKLVENNRRMVKALKEAGSSVRYDEYPGVGHNSWDRAYGTAELYTWFMKHTSK
jgi:predicted peptidase